jgi:hypothetical protein
LHTVFCIFFYFSSYSNNLIIDSSYVEKYLLKQAKDTSNILDPTTEPIAAPTADLSTEPTNDYSPTTEPTAAPTTEPTAAPTADPSSEPTNDYWTPPPIFRVTPPGDRPVLDIPTSTVKPSSSIPSVTPSSSVPSTVGPSSLVPSTITPSNLLSNVPTADPSSTPTADLWSPMPVAPVTHSDHDTIPHQVFYKPTIAPSTVAPSSSSSSVPSTISPSDLPSVVPSVAAIGE